MECCIIFLHHADDEVTRYHARLVRRQNPDSHFIPLTFREGIPGAVRPLRELPGNEWRNSDLLLYAWFQSQERISADRYFLIEYDTLCLASFRDFYADVWDADVACARIVKPEVDTDWSWFLELSNREPFGCNLLGMSPICGIMLSKRALTRMTRLAMNQHYKSLFCECRIGTLAATSGFVPRLIRPDIDKFISWQARIPSGPGIWHSVKELRTESKEALLGS